MKLFIDDLSETGKLDGLKFTYWDERFTSKVGAGSFVAISEKTWKS